MNNPPSTKLSYSKLKNAILNPSKPFLALKKSALGFCRLLKDYSLKKVGKTPSSHIIHSPGGEYLTVNEGAGVSYEELWRSRRVLSVEAVGRGGYHPRDLHNSSYDTKAEFNNCFIIHSK